jgi:5'-nucleotidase
VVPGKDPRGRRHFWITTDALEDPEEGTDRWAVEHGWVSLTPLRLDLTDEAALAAVASQASETPDSASSSPAGAGTSPVG